ncbi:carbamoyltransferase [Candidatus Moduliflexota bacterium]
MNILGISAYYHDSAAALVRDGRIEAAAQEERFTRIKHDHAFPLESVRYCLARTGLEVSDLDLVAFYEKPFLKFERILESYLSYAPLGFRSFLKAMPLWIKQKLWIKDYLRSELGFEGTIIFPEHHQSHAASAFFPSPFREAAFLTIDGVGEWTTTSWGVGRDNAVGIEADIPFPHSLGLLYSAFTYFTGFKVNSAEYKVMGLAPYGQPKYRDLILEELIDLREDGSFRLNMEYFDYVVGLKMTGDKFSRLFGGPPRRPESELTGREMDLARSVQEVTEEAVLRMGRHIRGETGLPNLCLAGGVGLNCVSNGKLLRAGIFDDIWIQPAAGDAGGALGAALVAWHQYHGGERSAPGADLQGGSYLGPEYSTEEIRTFLESRVIPFHELPADELPGKVADMIASEKVIGWFQGRMEFGPRALGSRSIIGDARSAKMQETMNLKIKFRESFRPFAPSVLAEKASDYFDIDCSSPYMLIVADVRKEHLRELGEDEHRLEGLQKLTALRSTVPAVTHVDCSARVQTVHRETNPLYHAVLSSFEERYGCPVIINTSFNVRGEPIVCSPEDAYRCFMRTDMDCLVLGSFLLMKNEQPSFTEKEDWRKEFELD